MATTQCRATLTEQEIRSILGTRVNAIEENPATQGEWVCWIDGAGHPVYSLDDVLALRMEG